MKCGEKEKKGNENQGTEDGERRTEVDSKEIACFLTTRPSEDVGWNHGLRG